MPRGQPVCIGSMGSRRPTRQFCNASARVKAVHFGHGVFPPARFAGHSTPAVGGRSLASVRLRDNPKRRAEDAQVNRWGYRHTGKRKRSGGAGASGLVLEGLNRNVLARTAFKEQRIRRTEYSGRQEWACARIQKSLPCAVRGCEVERTSHLKCAPKHLNWQPFLVKGNGYNRDPCALHDTYNRANLLPSVVENNKIARELVVRLLPRPLCSVEKQRCEEDRNPYAACDSRIHIRYLPDVNGKVFSQPNRSDRHVPKSAPSISESQRPSVSPFARKI